MATTTKTLTPTNQTITLPDMTERPNASVLVDGIGKDADAINALSEQIATLNSKIAWKYINSKMGIGSTNYIEYPSSALELTVNVAWFDNLAYVYPLYISNLGNSKYYKAGCYGSSSDYGSVIIRVDTTNRHVYIESLILNGTEITTNAFFEVLYR